jgi:hypothetical protein
MNCVTQWNFRFTHMDIMRMHRYCEIINHYEIPH